MGRGYIKQKNSLKKQMLKPLQDYCKQLEAENATLKGDPQTLIGSFIGQFRELYGQNQRLSVLAASLIKQLGDKAVLTKDEMEAYKEKRINIKWEIADGETVETAKEFTFSYELQEAPVEGQPVQATEQPTPAAITAAADIDPVEIAEGIVAENATQTEVYQAKPMLTVEEAKASLDKDPDCLCEDPDCPASDNGPHIHASKIATPSKE